MDESPSLLMQKIAKLEKEIADLNALINLYDEDSRKDQQERKDLERQLTNIRVQLELLEKKRDRFMQVEQFLIELEAKEKKRDFVEELGVCGPPFALSSLVNIIISGNKEEAWSAVNMYHSRIREVSLATTSLLNSMINQSKVVTAQQHETSNVVDDQMIKRLVDEALEGRTRTLVRDLYDQALTLPNRIREIYAAFSRDRSQFQDIIHERKCLTDDLMQTHRLDAKFSILRDGIERRLPLHQPEAVAELEDLIQFARSSQTHLNELDEQAAIIANRIEQYKKQYLDANDIATSLWDRAAHIRSHCSLYGLPYPAEVEREVSHTKQLLSFVNPQNEESSRISNMSRYSTTISDRPKALKDFLATALPLAEALLLRVMGVNPENLFRDKPSRNDAFGRLFMIASLVCNHTESNMFRGHKGRKTLVESVLKSGLVSKKDADAFRLVPDQLKSLYEIQRFMRGWMWEPKAECVKLAQQFLFIDCRYQDAVRSAILEGSALYKEEQKAERKALAQNSSTDELDTDDEDL